MISEPAPESGLISTSDKEEPSKLGAIALVTSHVSQAVIKSTSSKETSNDIEEQAATKAQAAFRGYLAHRAFCALKGIIRLQALIRGHLVRRQAVATLHAMEGIVKLQAVAHGRSVRCTFTGLKVTKSSVKRRLWFQKILSEEIHDGVDDDTAELGQPSSSPSETSQNNLKSKVLFISSHPPVGEQRSITRQRTQAIRRRRAFRGRVRRWFRWRQRKQKGRRWSSLLLLLPACWW